MAALDDLLRFQQIQDQTFANALSGVNRIQNFNLQQALSKAERENNLKERKDLINLENQLLTAREVDRDKRLLDRLTQRSNIELSQRLALKQLENSLRERSVADEADKNTTAIENLFTLNEQSRRELKDVALTDDEQNVVITQAIRDNGLPINIADLRRFQSEPDLEEIEKGGRTITRSEVTSLLADIAERTTEILGSRRKDIALQINRRQRVIDGILQTGKVNLTRLKERLQSFEDSPNDGVNNEDPALAFAQKQSAENNPVTEDEIIDDEPGPIDVGLQSFEENKKGLGRIRAAQKAFGEFTDKLGENVEEKILGPTAQTIFDAGRQHVEELIKFKQNDPEKNIALSDRLDLMSEVIRENPGAFFGLKSETLQNELLNLERKRKEDEANERLRQAGVNGIIEGNVFRVIDPDEQVPINPPEIDADTLNNMGPIVGGF